MKTQMKVLCAACMVGGCIAGPANAQSSAPMARSNCSTFGRSNCSCSRQNGLIMRHRR